MASFRSPMNKDDARILRETLKWNFNRTNLYINKLRVLGNFWNDVHTVSIQSSAYTMYAQQKTVLGSKWSTGSLNISTMLTVLTYW